MDTIEEQFENDDHISTSADQRAEMDGLIIRAATDKLVALRGSDVATLEQMRVVLAQLRAAADRYILARWDMGEHLGPSWNRVVSASLSLKDADDALAAAIAHQTEGRTNG